MFDMVFEAIDPKQITALLLLDLSKAFDNIDQRILLSNCKLRVLGVSREAIERFRSYLSDRTQCVRVGHEVSGPREGGTWFAPGVVFGTGAF